MDAKRIPATAAQAKAIANPLRLRILRLCTLDELTNRELATRLDRDPSTILHHIRLLVEAGFLEAAAERPGPRGSTQKPYRATGLTWQLEFDEQQHERGSALSILEAFRAELLEAGLESVRGWTRVVLHLTPDEAQDLQERLFAVIDEYVRTDGSRREAGSPPVNALIAMHDLHGSRPEDPPDQPG